MSDDVITQNARNHPEAFWRYGSILDAELPESRFDVVYSYFVLEHCVYPERVLKRALQLVKPSGVLLLVFPDFVEMGRFGSQMLGYRKGRASEHLRNGRPVSAVFALYESRIRLPRALRRAVAEFGPFPVNLNVKCLVDHSEMEPDVDAVYISSKHEVQSWAERHGCRVAYPMGTEGNFRVNALMEIEPGTA
jgi:SAM-dependent methyltransferase